MLEWYGRPYEIRQKGLPFTFFKQAMVDLLKDSVILDQQARRNLTPETTSNKRQEPPQEEQTLFLCRYLLSLLIQKPAWNCGSDENETTDTI